MTSRTDGIRCGEEEVLSLAFAHSKSFSADEPNRKGQHRGVEVASALLE